MTPMDAADALPTTAWGHPTADVVLAVHGITASSRAWLELAAQLPERRLLAPDLRGRGAARDLPGPWGLRRHADDLVATLQAQGARRAVVVGHSMGAFVAVALAARHPGSVSALVLVDGGIPLPPLPTDVAGDGLALLGPAADRLRMSFADAEDHRTLWREHPAFRQAWSPAIEAYVAADLVPEAGRWRSAVSLEAAAADVQELRGPDWYLAALAAIRCPVVFLRAPRGLQDEPDALYPPEVHYRVRELLPWARTIEVPDVNHYTIVMTPSGAAAVAAAVRDLTPIHTR